MISRLVVVAVICVLLGAATTITGRAWAFPSVCIKDNDGRCCPPVSICGGALATCNGCPNFGDSGVIMSQFHQIAVSYPTLELTLAQLKHQAHILYDNEKDVQALTLFKQILHITPKDPKTLTDMGSTENDLTNFTGGLFYFREALILDPHHIGALLGVGNSLEGLGNHSAALVYYKEAASTPIPTQQQHTKLGLVEQIEKADALTHLRNYSQALSIDDAILKQNTTDIGALGSKGTILIKLKDYNGALAIFNQIHPVIPWVLDNRAVALTQLGNYTGAISTADASITLDPNDTYAWYNRAAAFLGLDLYSKPNTSHSQPLVFKDIGAMLHDLNKTLSINPHDSYAQHLKTELTNNLNFGNIVR
jgi:tetratricopeptide (TPR) repeat protein